MTVSYSKDIATANGFAFVRLLCRWKGSVYKLIWLDCVIFLVLFCSLHVTYSYILGAEAKIIFEKMVRYADKCVPVFPISFILGFYVSTVMTRWWNQYQTIPWPTSLAVYVSSTIHGYDEVGRAMRRTIMRYTCLSMTMVFRVLSPSVQKRYPLMSDLIHAGLLTESELEVIEKLDKEHPELGKNFLPIVWASSIVTKARLQGRIYDDAAVKTLIAELNTFRGNCGSLMAYASVSIPLVYTQVVTIATYSYFLTMVMAHQVLDNDHRENFVVPYIMIMLFIFYMGWLKVAETLLNPFGDDDDDFDLCTMIERSIATSYLIVDDMHNEHPEIVKDQYWDGYPMRNSSLNSNDKSAPGAIDENDFIDFSDDKRTLKPTANALPRQDEEVTIRVNEPARLFNDNLIPDETVIDQSRYSDRIDQVLMEQSVLEENMNRTRRRTATSVLRADNLSQSSQEALQTPNSAKALSDSLKRQNSKIPKSKK